MRPDQRIRVNELLLQREELFLRIHAVETEVTRLLGEPWPFTRPALPSDRRGKRKPAPASSSPASSSAAPARSPLREQRDSASASAPLAVAPASPADLRRLEPDEAAYRVTYRQFGREFTETHHDFAALATLLAAQSAQLRVLRVETLDASGATRATLYPIAPADLT